MSTKHAILGLLSYKPMHGYEIKHNFEESVSYIWSINYGQLYPLLRKMEHEGLIKKETVHQSNRPDRIVYQIDEAGKKELQKWFDTPTPKRQVKDEFYLKMIFLNHADKKTAKKLIDQQIKSVEEQYNVLLNIKNQHGHKMDGLQLLHLESGLMHFATDIEWLKLCKEKVLNNKHIFGECC